MLLVFCAYVMSGPYSHSEHVYRHVLNLIMLTVRVVV